MLYLDAGGWDDLLDDRQVGVFSPFAMPEGMQNAIDAGGRPGRDFGDVRAQPDVNLYDAVREHSEAARKAGRRVILAFYSPGSLDRLTAVMGDHGLRPIEVARNYPEIEALQPPARVARRMAPARPACWATDAPRSLKRIKRIMIRTFTANLPLILQGLMDL